jgi:dynein heavy chain, axonemal
LIDLQASILSELAESDSTTILDNIKLIETLETTGEESRNIALSLTEAQEVERTINDRRNEYRSVAIRGSILYFSIVDMTGIDPMY